MSDRARLQRWTPAEMDAYEHARAMLNAVIAAYSARVGTAPNPQEARALREEREPVLIERDRLTADHRERIAEIIREMPARLAAVRDGGAGE
ncbi:hypothetical protein AB0C59_27330 [Streptomyces sp. NPDC048664]|uniref:hypothetical protein n=1 Tax=Streptomyces sp. NPDC048664 TaxID=3154505 RepID=UPI00344496CE